MNLRLAKKEDLHQLKEMFTLIVNEMNKNSIHIWNEDYPFEEFENDIKNYRLYVLTNDDIICAAFAMFDEIDGSNLFEWESNKSKVMYIGRFGVNAKFLRKGIGTKSIKCAKEICKLKGAKYLRLTVAEENLPAISLYVKNGFKKVNGLYKEYSQLLGKIIKEIGFEIKIQ